LIPSASFKLGFEAFQLLPFAMVSTVLNLESAMWSDLSKAPLKREESPSCAASTVAPTLSRQNSAESAFSAAPRQPLSPAHQENHWKPVDAELRRPAGEDVQSMAFPSKASMVQSLSSSVWAWMLCVASW
jgi:hypothetical protein